MMTYILAEDLLAVSMSDDKATVFGKGSKVELLEVDDDSNGTLWAIVKLTGTNMNITYATLLNHFKQAAQALNGVGV